MVLVPDLVGRAYSLHLLQTLSALSDVDVDVTAQVEDEAVALVHGGHGKIHLAHTNVLLSLDVEETLLAGRICLYLVKTTSDSSGQVANTILVVAKEHLRLVVLDFTMLDWGAIQQIIQLDCHNSRRSSLILGGLQSQPEVHVP